MLAAASIGAIWSSTSPDFGVNVSRGPWATPCGHRSRPGQWGPRGRWGPGPRAPQHGVGGGGLGQKAWAPGPGRADPPECGVGHVGVSDCETGVPTSNWGALAAERGLGRGQGPRGCRGGGPPMTRNHPPSLRASWTASPRSSPSSSSRWRPWCTTASGTATWTSCSGWCEVRPAGADVGGAGRRGGRGRTHRGLCELHTTPRG